LFAISFWRVNVPNMIRPIRLLALLLMCSLARAETNAPGVKPLPSGHLENLFSISGKVFSGSSPHDEQGFVELKKLGIKTIISVDGGKPDSETARKHGFRYIHLPMGYDGASLSNANRILKAAESSQGPVYIHCHHGKHRGPAAAAVICQGFGIWNTNEAVTWMKQAGTSPDYPGLFRMAAEFKRSPDYEKISNDFPEQATVSGLIDAMVEIDERWGHLKAVQKAGYKVPPAHPDLVPANEAVILIETYRELRRSKDAQARGADFLSRLEKAEQETAALHGFLKSNRDSIDARRADPLWFSVAQSCASCHKKYRN
jgi:protein tyrosine phosphatase (PTP) superfamily phosphohydrolase (DUF442 family)